MTISDCINDTLMSGCDDWVYLAEILSFVRTRLNPKTDSELRQHVMQIVEQLIIGDLMELGDVDVAGEWDTSEGFRKWNLSKEESLNRLARDWDALGRNPSLWELCWLRITPKGDAIGRELLKNWKPD